MGSEGSNSAAAGASKGRERRVCDPCGSKVVARPDQRVAALAGEQWGVLSIGELQACGLTRRAVTKRVQSGRLHLLHRGVYAVGHANPPLEGDFLAAVKACGPAAVLSHRSAAALWGFVDWDDRRPEVTVAGRGTRGHGSIRTHRTECLLAKDVRHHDGIRVTSPARTLLDLAGQLPYPALRGAVREGLSLRLLSVRDLAEILERLGGRRGSAKLARIVSSGPAPTRSVLEDVVLDLIRRGGLAQPDVNVPLAFDGRRVIPDFRWPKQHLIVEADGATWHDSKVAREEDAERQALLEAHGERVVRVTWRQAITRPTQTLSRIRAAGAPTAES